MKLLKLLIITLPLYATPLIAGLPPLFSWTSILLIALMGIFVANGKSTGVVFAYLFSFFVLFGIFTAIFVDPPMSGLYYFAQVCLLILPLPLAFHARNYFSSELPRDISKILILDISYMLASMSVGVILQWALHSFAGLSLGHIGDFGLRVTYDLTIPAYSVVSGILSLGIVVAPALWKIKFRMFAVLLPVVSTIAILINTSRTGIFAAVISVLFIILFPPRGVSKTNSRLLLIPGILISLLLYRLVAGLDRFKENSAVLDDNGRFDTISHALSEFSASLQNYLVGLGYAYDFGVNPHNSVIETLVKSGVINLSIIIILVAFTFYQLRGSYWFFLLLTLVIGSMFYSGFYGVKFFPAVAILGIISQSCKDSSQQRFVGERRKATQVLHDRYHDASKSTFGTTSADNSLASVV